jgi:hypothetical protein
MGDERRDGEAMEREIRGGVDVTFVDRGRYKCKGVVG